MLQFSFGSSHHNLYSNFVVKFTFLVATDNYAISDSRVLAILIILSQGRYVYLYEGHSTPEQWTTMKRLLNQRNNRTIRCQLDSMSESQKPNEARR